MTQPAARTTARAWAGSVPAGGTYAQDMARLTAAVAALTAQPPTQPLPPGQVLPVLAARDTVTSELRALGSALLRAAPLRTEAGSSTGRTGSAGGPGEPAGDSALHQLAPALAALPPASGADRPPLTKVLAAGSASASQGDPYARTWLNAARSAAMLEAQHDTVADLVDPSAAWAVARDLAELSAALPYLDADLATAFPPNHAARAVLLDPATHGPLRLAAEHLRGQTADLTGPAVVPPPTAAQLPPAGLVERTSHLPPATAHLVALVQARGPDLTAVEANVVSRALAAGVHLSARVLDRTPGSSGTDATRHLAAAVGHLPQLLTSNLATLTRPDQDVLALASQVTGQLSRLSQLADRVLSLPDPADRAAPIADLLSRWAPHGAGLAAALSGGLQQAGADNRLLAPRQDLGRGKDARYLWLRLHPAEATHHPALQAAAHTADALRAGTPTQRANPAGTSTSTGTSTGTAAGATSRADGVLAGLRTALQTRTPSQLPPLPRPGHPAQRPTPQPLHSGSTASSTPGSTASSTASRPPGAWSSR